MLKQLLCCESLVRAEHQTFLDKVKLLRVQLRQSLLKTDYVPDNRYL
jgi:hypothetical protein